MPQLLSWSNMLFMLQLEYKRLVYVTGSTYLQFGLHTLHMKVLSQDFLSVTAVQALKWLFDYGIIFNSKEMLLTLREST